MPLKYSVITFGCRVNQSDSLAFEEQCLARGGEAVAPESADLVLVNSCSVTASADQGARQTIRRLARVNPAARIVVTGCFATRDPQQVAALPGVGLVVANDDKPRLLSLVDGLRLTPTRTAEEPGTAVRFGDGEGSCGATIEPGVAGRTAFTLRVQTGCAESCAYCIIPETRGAPRSTPLETLLAEVDRVVKAGFREVALTGVHLGSYGRDLSPCLSLFELLSALRDRYEPSTRLDARGVRLRTGLDRTAAPQVLFRVSSLEPMDCTPEIVRLMRESACFAPHFHLPLQHASLRMLRAMRRPYAVDDYAALVNEIRRVIPHASIGSDIIVGFPGESDEDFSELERYLETSPLTHLHVFPYSDRPGTEASKMGDRPAGATVKARGARVREIGAALHRRFLTSQLGTVHRALTLEDGTLAVTGNYLKMRIPPGRPRNEWVDVRITATAPTLVGELA